MTSYADWGESYVWFISSPGDSCSDAVYGTKKDLAAVALHQILHNVCQEVLCHSQIQEAEL